MKNKLSPIEELRAERLRLRIELTKHEANIKNNFTYVKSNWGSMLLSSIFSPSPNSEKSSNDLYTGNSKGLNNLSSLYSKISGVAPVIWDIAQPILLGMITKKVSSFFFGKKSKGTKEITTKRKKFRFW